jgi:glucokinase
MKTLGIDIGGSFIKFGVLDPNDEIIDSYELPNIAQSKSDFLQAIAPLISSLNSKYNFSAVGIGLPGSIEPNGIVSASPNLSYWVAENFIESLAPYFQCPIFVQNDAYLAGFAEAKNNKLEEYYFVTLGTGIGSVLIRENKIIMSNNGSSGELGHIIIDFKQIGSDFRVGVFEKYFNPQAFVERAKSEMQLFPNSVLATLDSFTVREISEAVAMGDDLAILTFIAMGEVLGIGLSSAANLTGVPNFVIGGGISQSNNLLFETAIKKMRERVIPELKDLVEVRISNLYNQAGTLGAALFARENLQ